MFCGLVSNCKNSYPCKLEGGNNAEESMGDSNTTSPESTVVSLKCKWIVTLATPILKSCSGTWCILFNSPHLRWNLTLLDSLYLIVGFVKNHILETCEGHEIRSWRLMFKFLNSHHPLTAKIPLGGFLYFLCCMLMRACLGPLHTWAKGHDPCNCEGPWLSSKGV